MRTEDDLKPPPEDPPGVVVETRVADLVQGWRREILGRSVWLVVDDDGPVRATLASALERAGYRVLQASDGKQGLDIFRDHAQTVAAVISDAVMPAMDGQSMLRVILQARPDLPVLVCSGYSADLFEDDFFDHPRHAFLGKPFRPRMLLRAVRMLLDGPVRRASLHPTTRQLATE